MVCPQGQAPRVLSDRLPMAMSLLQDSSTTQLALQAAPVALQPESRSEVCSMSNVNLYTDSCAITVLLAQN